MFIIAYNSLVKHKVNTAPSLVFSFKTMKGRITLLQNHQEDITGEGGKSSLLPST